MEPPAPAALITQFACLPDPRIDRTKRHPLLRIVTIALCAVIFGAESWNDIAEFGEARAEWFASFLDLPHGIPSHDTSGLADTEHTLSGFPWDALFAIASREQGCLEFRETHQDLRYSVLAMQMPGGGLRARVVPCHLP